MFLEYNYVRNSGNDITPRICFGCESGCFLRCTGCTGCLGCKNSALKSTS